MAICFLLTKLYQILFFFGAPTALVGQPGKEAGIYFNQMQACSCKGLLNQISAKNLSLMEIILMFKCLKIRFPVKRAHGPFDGMHLRFWKINIPFSPENHSYQT